VTSIDSYDNGRERMKKLNWNTRFAIAAYEAGWTIPEHLVMSAQMVLNGGGCSTCVGTGR
jgi:hypothetical protein